MIAAFIQFIEQSVIFIGTQFIHVLNYPFLASEYIFWPYLLSSAVLALYVYSFKNQSDPDHKGSIKAFINFLFPRYIWQSASAWLDVRYFLLYQIFRSVLYGVFLVSVLNQTFQFISGGPNMVLASNLSNDPKSTGMMISIIYMFGLIAFVDFFSYVMHYVQHKVPLLWEFHKVHHSLEVMHPLSNYREHPIDNIFYAVITGMAYGLFMGLVQKQFGFLPTVPQLLGIPLLVIAFKVLGYNLRHSHIWLRWPGRLSMVFASPAHHQIHHSYHPDHLDKNFAFIFPFWDVLFRTYQMPETNEDVRFGISKHYDNEYKSCLGIILIPFRNAYLLMSDKLKQISNKGV